MIDESPRQRVYDAIDRECLFRGETDDRSLDDWINVARGELEEARGRWLAFEYPVCRMKLLQATATMIACLEQHLGWECDHIWWIDHAIGESLRDIRVACSQCHTKGIVHHATAHEYKQAEVLVGALRWWEPNRVVVTKE